MKILLPLLLMVVLLVGCEDEDAKTPNILEDSNDYFITWNTYDTYDYVFDVNSDPLIISKMMVHYMKTNPAYGSTITLSVPLKDKAEYDAIMEGNDIVEENF